MPRLPHVSVLLILMLWFFPLFGLGSQHEGPSDPSQAITVAEHPLLYFAPTRPIKTEAGLLTSLQSFPGARFRSMTSRDLSGDGLADLICGWSSSDGHFLTLHDGNIDWLFPRTPAAIERRLTGLSVDAPFLSAAREIESPVAPDFVGSGDFNGDGSNDLVIAAEAGQRLYWLLSGPNGQFGDVRQIELGGAVTAFHVADVNRQDGLSDVIVAVSSKQGTRLLVFEGPRGAALAQPETFSLPSSARDITTGHLNQDWKTDIVAAMSDRVLVIFGRDRMLTAIVGDRGSMSAAETREYLSGLESRSVLVGDFVGDSFQELAVLSADGDLFLFNSSDDGPVKPVDLRPEFTGLRGGRLSKARVSIRRHEQIVSYGDGPTEVLLPDQPAGLRRAVFESSSPSSRLLPMRLNDDAWHDLVMYDPAREGLRVVESEACDTGKVYLVNDTSNISRVRADGRCDVDDEEKGDQCTLASAIRAGNNTGMPYRINFDVDGPVQRGVIEAIKQPICIDGGGRIQANSFESVVEFQVGLAAGGGNSVLRGMKFLSGGISFSSDNNHALGNHVVEGGLTVSRGSNNTIGGAAAAARNIVETGFTSGLIQVTGSAGLGNEILGNFVGTDETGSEARADFVEDLRAGHFLGSVGIHVRGSSGTRIIGNLVAGHNTNVALRGAIEALVQGNTVGTNRDGTAALQPEARFGVYISGGIDNTIGGTAEGLGNLISGHAEPSTRIVEEGIGVMVDKTSGTKVQGNRIGTNRDGNTAIPNTEGVFITGQLGVEQRVILVGGEGGSNLISGNILAGVVFHNSVEDLVMGMADVQLLSNRIGTDASGAAPLPNEGTGVEHRRIFSDALVQSNRIAYNGSHGFWAFQPTTSAIRIAENDIFSNGGAGVSIRGPRAKGIALSENRIHDNAGLGIDLSLDGVTPNDPGDADTGSNDLQNFPVLTKISEARVQVTLDSTPDKTFNIELFASDQCDPSGHGEGEEFFRSFSLTTGASREVSVPVGKVITATATDDAGNTSEFSACAQEDEKEPFVVNSTGDDPDENAEKGDFDGICSTGKKVSDPDQTCNPTVEGDCECTLRAAIREANSDQDPDTVIFRVPGEKPAQIFPVSQLPTITEPVTIEANRDIVLTGALAGDGTDGLTITAGNSSVKGLVINGFEGHGIVLDDKGGNTIQANYIGTDAAGLSADKNGMDGIKINSSDNIIGGTTDAARNVISGNGQGGVRIHSGAGFRTFIGNTRVLGNFIGTDRTGKRDLGNGSGCVGGDELCGHGVLVGVDVGQVPGIPVLQDVIGGSAPGASNVIAFNRGAGVFVRGGKSVSISSNSIFSNGGLGIDLYPPGVNPNGLQIFRPVNAGGGSYSQVYPILSDAVVFNGSVTIRGELRDALAGVITRLSIEFFSSRHCDPTLHGEGETLLGRIKSPDVFGGITKLKLRATFPSTALPGHSVTAVVLKGENTSEFSPCVTLKLDSDGDGYSDEFEDSGPNGGDVNNDGSPDRLQKDVVCLPNAVDGRLVCGVVVSGEAEITPVREAPSPGTKPSGVLAESGLFDLTVSEFQSSELFSETALSSQPGCPETAFYGLGRRHEVPT